MKSGDYLVLQYEGLAQRTTQFFERLRDSSAIRTLFVRNPVEVIATEVFPNAQLPSTAELNRANRVLFSLLGNERFMEWARRFQREEEDSAREAAQGDEIEAQRLLAVRLERPRVYREVIEAIRTYGDQELLYSLLIVDPETQMAQPAPVSIDEKMTKIILSPVLIEALVIFIDVFIVLRLAVEVEFIAVPAVAAGLSREDLQRISNLLSDQFNERASTLRETGTLTSADAIHRGGEL